MLSRTLVFNALVLHFARLPCSWSLHPANNCFRWTIHPDALELIDPSAVAIRKDSLVLVLDDVDLVRQLQDKKQGGWYDAMMAVSIFSGSLRDAGNGHNYCCQLLYYKYLYYMTGNMFRFEVWIYLDLELNIETYCENN